MPDYAEMYRTLFQSQTEAIELLKEAQKDAEEIYMSSPEPDIKLFPQHEKSDDNNK